MTSRRTFLEQAALSTLAAVVPASLFARQSRTNTARGFLDIHRQPDTVVVQTQTGELSLTNVADRWAASGVTVSAIEAAGALRLQLAAPATAVKTIRLRWRGRMSETARLLGDAWERAYGDLEWRGWVPDRVMPWYAAVRDGALTHVYGVRTGARAFCQ